MLLFITYVQQIYAKDGKIFALRSSTYQQFVFKNFPEGTCNIDDYDIEL